MRIHPGITMQREFSLLDGAPRERPLQPIRRSPAIVQIGQKRIMARVESAPPDERKAAFVRNRAKRLNHECAETLLGQFCGHLDA